MIEDELYFENRDTSNIGAKLKNYNGDKFSFNNDELNQTGNDSTTNYIIDFARNAVNNGNAYLGDDGGSSEVGDDNNSENDPNKVLYTRSNSVSALKGDFENDDHNIG